jgi:HEPN domain-containing protein
MDKIVYWTELSNYDLETARAMLLTKRYLYVGFMCHQTIEKILKAYWSKVLDETPLKTHSLSRLAETSKLQEMLSEEQMDFIDTLEPLNIEARYPSYKARLLQSLTPAYCNTLLQQTEHLQQWIKNKL